MYEWINVLKNSRISTVTYVPIARQRLSIHVPADMQQWKLCSLWTMLQNNNSDNRRGAFYVNQAMPNARQRRCKHASLIEESVFYVVRAAAI
jgi:hypothetical protein